MKPSVSAAVSDGGVGLPGAAFQANTAAWR